jgi:nucleoside-diphosphate-sugar epimerase
MKKRALLTGSCGLIGSEVAVFSPARAFESSASSLRPNLIVHTAAQPSHDRTAAIPFLDFEVNGVGTLNMLEAARGPIARQAAVGILVSSCRSIRFLGRSL